MKKSTKIGTALLALLLALNTAACGDQTVPAGTGAAKDAASYKIAIVQFNDEEALTTTVQGLEMELDAKAKENNVVFDYVNYYYNSNGDEAALSGIMTEIEQTGVDAIVPIATPAAAAAKAAFGDTDIPIVFAAVSDPIGAKLVDSLEQPGANITGTSDMLNSEAIVNIIFAVDPSCDRVGLLYDEGEIASAQSVLDVKNTLYDNYSVNYSVACAATADEAILAARNLVESGAKAVFTPSDNTIVSCEAAVAETFTAAGIPQYCGADSFAANGAFLGYGTDYIEVGSAAADLVTDILVNGADPAATPVVLPTNGIATINTDTAAALGYDLAKIKTAIQPYCEEIKEVSSTK